ncbi:PAAR domain-containing protein [Atopomonas hussainii]|uniref:PAAR domain-containing protein n=1 Tax=Atopomonas hussainii TaxID=1429083 RepID=UPI000900306C|nr:PAAR domain-containing protein [Atopomonas hussainii]
MPKAGRLGDQDTGHDACGPTAVIAGSPNVLINNLPALRLGDPLAVHGCPAHAPHGRALAVGSGTVLINNLPAGRVGDAVNCGGVMVQGSPNVLIG